MNEKVATVKQQLQSDVIQLVLSHRELLDIQKEFSSKHPDSHVVIAKCASLLEKDTFRSDVAKVIEKYNESLKPFINKESVLEQIDCLKENKCDPESFKMIVSIAKAILTFYLDPKVNRAFMNAIKNQLKVYSLFLQNV
jgi:predicted nucleic-acid-binding protein